MKKIFRWLKQILSVKEAVILLFALGLSIAITGVVKKETIDKVQAERDALWKVKISQAVLLSKRKAELGVVDKIKHIILKRRSQQKEKASAVKNVPSTEEGF